MIDIAEVKRSLNITWDDPDTDAKVSDMMVSAEAMINDYAGTRIDYSRDAIAMQLLKDCIRYIWNDCIDEFENRYRSQLIAMRNTYKVMDYVSESKENKI